MKRLRLAHVLLIIAALVAVVSLFSDIGSYDFWWHLKAGEHIWGLGAVPTTDPFSFTMQGQPWTAHEWLFEAVMWLFYTVGNLYGIMLLFFLIALATAVVLWKLYGLRHDRMDHGRQLLIAVLVAIAMGPTLPYWSPRPGALSYLLFVLFLYVLKVARTRQTAAPLWLLPLLTAIWVNAHGSFVLGPALIVGELVFGWKDFNIGVLNSRSMHPRVRKGMLYALGGTILASAINPHGFRMFIYTATISSHSFMKNSIVEWFSPNFHEAYFGIIVTAVLLPALLWMLADTRGDTLQDMVYLVGFIYMFLSSQRYFPFPALYLGYILARRVPSSEVLKKLDRPVMSVGLVCFIALALALKLPANNVSEHVSQEKFPVEAATFIEQTDLEGRIFNRYGWGGYLVWRFYPERKVFIDGRADLYLTGEVFEDYIETVELKVDPEKTLDKYDIEYVLMQEDAQLVRYLTATGRWKSVYEDETAVLLERAD